MSFNIPKGFVRPPMKEKDENCDHEWWMYLRMPGRWVCDKCDGETEDVHNERGIQA